MTKRRTADQIQRLLREADRNLAKGLTVADFRRKQAIAEVLARTRTGTGINTSSIERLNATFRANLNGLVRRGRALWHHEGWLQAGMSLVGCAYNWCWESDGSASEARTLAAKGVDWLAVVTETEETARWVKGMLYEAFSLFKFDTAGMQRRLTQPTESEFLVPLPGGSSVPVRDVPPENREDRTHLSRQPHLIPRSGEGFPQRLGWSRTGPKRQRSR
jgi:hypothetical protein